MEKNLKHKKEYRKKNKLADISVQTLTSEVGLIMEVGVMMPIEAHVSIITKKMCNMRGR